MLTTRRYDAFGNLELGATNGQAFTGREWDSETGLYYYRARYYEPKMGRFISEDPIDFGGGVNFYAYVAGNPVNLTDPSGLLQVRVGFDSRSMGIGLGQTGFSDDLKVIPICTQQCNGKWNLEFRVTATIMMQLPRGPLSSWIRSHETKHAQQFAHNIHDGAAHLHSYEGEYDSVEDCYRVGFLAARVGRANIVSGIRRNQAPIDFWIFNANWWLRGGPFGQ